MMSPGQLDRLRLATLQVEPLLTCLHCTPDGDQKPLTNDA